MHRLLCLEVTIEADQVCMAPLRGFVYTMSLSYPVSDGRDDFGILNKLVNATAQSPTVLTPIFQRVRDAKPASSGLLAGFRMIPQGKKLMALAEELVLARAETMKVVGGIDEVKTKASTFRSATTSMKLGDLILHCKPWNCYLCCDL